MSMSLSKSPAETFDQVMLRAGLIDPNGHQQLAKAFNERLRVVRQQSPLGAPPQPPVGQPRPAPQVAAPSDEEDELELPPMDDDELRRGGGMWMECLK